MSPAKSAGDARARSAELAEGCTRTVRRRAKRLVGGRSCAVDRGQRVATQIGTLTDPNSNVYRWVLQAGTLLFY